MEEQLTHLDQSGNIQMVDVSLKAENKRLAVAEGEIRMKLETLELIQSGAVKKGDVLTVAKIAGIQAAKNTSNLIPLCHPLGLTFIEVDLKLDFEIPGIVIRATVKTTGKTGVEMEALTAVMGAALTIYDMAKAVEKTMTIQNVRLVEKRGGKSGVYLEGPQS